MNKPAHYFLDGAAIGRDSLALAAQFNEDPNADISRILLKIGPNWRSLDFSDDVIRSLSFDFQHQLLCMLGESGAVYFLGRCNKEFEFASIKGTLRRTDVVDPDESGQLLRIRASNGRIFACGQAGQIFEYDLDKNYWQSIGVHGGSSHDPDFEDMAMTESGQLLAVGLNGVVALVSEVGLTLLDSPTNQHLSSVVKASNQDLYACGNKATILRISRSQSEVITTGQAGVGNLWAIESFCGNLYAASPGALVQLVGTDLLPVDVDSKAKVSFNRLSAHRDELWSIGADHVYVLTGSAWSRVQVPGNEIQ